MHKIIMIFIFLGIVSVTNAQKQNVWKLLTLKMNASQINGLCSTGNCDDEIPLNNGKTAYWKFDSAKNNKGVTDVLFSLKGRESDFEKTFESLQSIGFNVISKDLYGEDYEKLYVLSRNSKTGILKQIIILNVLKSNVALMSWALIKN